MSDVKALVIDFGGVLTTPLQNGMIRFAMNLGIELQDLVRVALKAYSGEDDDLVHDFETGHVSEEEFSIAFSARLREEAGAEVEADRLVERIFEGLELVEEMMSVVVAIRRAGYKTALCSNSWGLGLYPYDRFPEMFDVVVISGEVGMRKPNRDIFDLTLEKLDLPAPTCVFVDDHPGHLKGAAEVGMQTVLHRTPEETIAELERIFGLN
jgi:epoxide hydrolase-like predicted phosphatase